MLLQGSHVHVQVQLDDARLEASKHRARCRQLQSEDALADVFNGYEAQVRPDPHPTVGRTQTIGIRV